LLLLLADVASSDHPTDANPAEVVPKASVAAAAAADSSSGQLSQVLSELQQKPDKLMQQVLDLLDQKIAAAEAKQAAAAAAAKQQAAADASAASHRCFCC